MKINVAGVRVDRITKAESLRLIEQFVASGRMHYAVTPYSEMIVFAQDNPEYLQALNQADLSLADGFGVVLAAKLLGLPIPERITGRMFIYDLASLAQAKNFSLALVGGTDGVAKLAAQKLQRLYPGLKINLALSDLEFNDSLIEKINGSNSDILVIAYSPPKQELWLSHNRGRLKVKFAIGLGGTLDYLAGKRPVPPKAFHAVGLEWLWRLITQPWRIKRIWNAVPVFLWKVFKYKVNNQ